MENLSLQPVFKRFL